MKDFYDIYYLANHYDFDGQKLQEAIFETLNNRRRIYEKETLDKVKLLLEDGEIIVRWKAFIKNTIKKELDFQVVLNNVITFIENPFEAIVHEN
jgi:hypothetical protein